MRERRCWSWSALLLKSRRKSPPVGQVLDDAEVVVADVGLDALRRRENALLAGLVARVPAEGRGEERIVEALQLVDRLDALVLGVEALAPRCRRCSRACAPPRRRAMSSQDRPGGLGAGGRRRDGGFLAPAPPPRGRQGENGRSRQPAQRLSDHSVSDLQTGLAQGRSGGAGTIIAERAPGTGTSGLHRDETRVRRAKDPTRAQMRSTGSETARRLVGPGRRGGSGPKDADRWGCRSVPAIRRI